MLTSAYTFRMLFLVFLGPPQKAAARGGAPREGGAAILIPLLVLAVPAALLGYVETPKFLGEIRLLSGLLGTALPGPPAEHDFHGAPAADPLRRGGSGRPGFGLARLAAPRARPGGPGGRGDGFWQAGWGFDALYRVLLVRPFLRLVDWAREDVVDRLYDLVAGCHPPAAPPLQPLAGRAVCAVTCWPWPWARRCCWP